MAPVKTSRVDDQSQLIVPKEFRQEKSKAGLLVTGELETAIARCKAKVERIATECRRVNRRFRDKEFDLEGDKSKCLFSLTPSAELKPAGVMRVSDIFTDPQFFIDGVNSSDIVQGALGDCWFLSALANLSSIPNLVERFCVARDEKVGVYGFIFFKDRGWVDVIIDDLLFTSTPKFEELLPAEQALYHRNKDIYNANARKGGKSLYFAKGGTENETWVPLVEKAYAKLHGDYQAIEGGETSEGIEDMSGGVCTFIYTKDILDPDLFWTNELLNANYDRLLGCACNTLDHSRGGANANTTINGLIPDHAYSILGAIEHKGKRFVRIRNPWGRAEWSGPWSDGSQEWTKEWLDALPVLGHTFGNDGTFLMEYNDFLDNWEVIDRTRLFDSTWVMSSLWLEVTARSAPAAWNYGDVSFTITIPAPTLAVIVLGQIDKRAFDAISGYCKWSFDFLLFKRGEKEPIAESMHAYIHSRSVNVEINLEPGEYIVHVRLDRTLFREKDYITKNGPTWTMRKYAKVVTEKTVGLSVAANFQPKDYPGLLPIPLDVFAGNDLTELEAESVRTATAKRHATEDLRQRPITVTTTISAPPQEETIIVTSPATDPSPSLQAPPAASDAIVYSCDGCQTSPIVGARYRDQDPSRPEFDLCQNCMNSGHYRSNAGWLRTDPPPPALIIHTGITCDGCQMDPLVGPRFKNQDPALANFDLCQSCMAAGNHPPTTLPWVVVDPPPKEASAPAPAPAEPPAPVVEVPAEPQRPLAEHSGVFCDGCKTGPIVGARYKCVDSACPDYDLCQNCYDRQVHGTTHRFLKLESPEEGQNTRRTYVEGDDDEVVLGLRVYTNRDAPAIVSGQLRHGNVIQAPWTRPGSK